MSERYDYGVLDTSVVIDLPEIQEERLPLKATITAVTLAELSQGPHLARDDRERAVRLERLQLAENAYLAPLPFDAGAARKYGSLVALTVAAGRKGRARRLDLMIAAIASIHGLPLFTRNADDFVGLQDMVRIEVV
ncbi:MAG: type II toxin-antitoxin system VapC family toxin [Trueperaceae bacterium]